MVEFCRTTGSSLAFNAEYPNDFMTCRIYYDSRLAVLMLNLFPYPTSPGLYFSPSNSTLDTKKPQILVRTYLQNHNHTQK